MSVMTSGEMPVEGGVDELPVYGNNKNALESRESLHQQILGYITLVIFTIGCIGNMLIIIYFKKVDRKKLKSMSAYHFLITILAILDLNVCAMKVVDTTLMIIYFNERINTNISEKVQGHLSSYYYRCLTATSIYILVIISFLRYRRITNPFTPTWGKITYLMLCLLSWCFCSGIWWLLTIVQFSKPYIIDSITNGVVPFIVLCFFYYKMSKSLNTDSKNNNNNDNSKSKGLSNCTKAANNQIRERNTIALRTVKYLIVIYFVTVVLVKIVVYSTMSYPSIKTDSKNFLIYRSYIDFFYLINNVGNVFVYAKLIRGFRCFLNNVLCGWVKSKGHINAKKN